MKEAKEEYNKTNQLVMFMVIATVVACTFIFDVISI